MIFDMFIYVSLINLTEMECIHLLLLLSDFINLTQVHNFTVSAQDIFTFRRLSVFTVSFTRILEVLIQIMEHFALYYWLVKRFWYRVYNQKVPSSNPRKFFFICIFTSLFDSFNFIIIDVSRPLRNEIVDHYIQKVDAYMKRIHWASLSGTSTCFKIE